MHQTYLSLKFDEKILNFLNCFKHLAKGLNGQTAKERLDKHYVPWSYMWVGINTEYRTNFLKKLRKPSYYTMYTDSIQSCEQLFIDRWLYIQFWKIITNSVQVYKEVTSFADHMLRYIGARNR